MKMLLFFLLCLVVSGQPSGSDVAGRPAANVPLLFTSFGWQIIIEGCECIYPACVVGVLVVSHVSFLSVRPHIPVWTARLES